MSRPRLRNLLLALVSASCLAFTVYVAHGLLARPGFVEVPIGGPFALLDPAGRSVSDRDLRGRHLLVYFGYTHCPDVCPTKLTEMTDGLGAFERTAPDLGARVTPVFITVDPARDMPEALAGYMPHFHERFVGLTGPVTEIAAVASAYRASFRMVPGEDPASYLMDHTSYVYLMGPDGRYITHFSARADAHQIAAGLARHLR